MLYVIKLFIEWVLAYPKTAAFADIAIAIIFIAAMGIVSVSLIDDKFKDDCDNS